MLSATLRECPRHLPLSLHDALPISEYSAPEGKFLTLDPKSAVEVKYAEGIVDHRVELLHELGLANATIVETETSLDRKSTRLNSSHVAISYAVFCLKKKKSE